MNIKESVMLGDKKIKETLYSIYRSFGKRYYEIVDFETGKVDKLSELVKSTSKKVEKLKSVDRWDELSDEDKEFIGESEVARTDVDENVVETLVALCVLLAKSNDTAIDGPVLGDPLVNGKIKEDSEFDSTDLEKDLRDFFTENYAELINIERMNDFLENATKAPSWRTEYKDKDAYINNLGPLAKIAYKHYVVPESFASLGSFLIVQDGLVAKEHPLGLDGSTVFYGTPEAIKARQQDLQSWSLYINQSLQMKSQITREDIVDAEEAQKDLGRRIWSYGKYNEKQNGIDSEESYEYRETKIDLGRIQAYANYVNRFINSSGIKAGDFTQLISDDIIRNYEDIDLWVRRNQLDLNDLENVKNALGIKGEKIGPSLYRDDDCTVYDGQSKTEIIWCDPQYLKKRCDEVLNGLTDVREKSPFTSGIENFKNRYRDYLNYRKYLETSGIEYIDMEIDTPEVEKNQDMINAIADTLMECAGSNYKEGRQRILSRLEKDWSNIMINQKHINCDEILRDELGCDIKRKDVISLEEGIAFLEDGRDNARCIYATSEGIYNTMSKIATSLKEGKKYYSKRMGMFINACQKYIQENGIEVDLSDFEIGDINGNATFGSSIVHSHNHYIPRPEPRPVPRQEFRQVIESDILAEVQNGEEIPFGKRNIVLVFLKDKLEKLRGKERSAKELYKDYEEQLPQEFKDENRR